VVEPPLDTGGRYDPLTDTWVATSIGGGARYLHTAVWTGSEMIIWGGQFGGSTGSRDDPATDTWAPGTTSGAPEPRMLHTAVWTGTEMIVWGGAWGYPDPLNTGGRYCASSKASPPGSLDGSRGGLNVTPSWTSRATGWRSCVPQRPKCGDAPHEKKCRRL